MSAVAGFLGVFLLIYLLIMAFSIVSYVLQSLGMYTIANRRGIHHPWLAWIPVGSSWLLGSISDQYHYVAKGEVRSKRKVLLGLSIASIALAFAMVICWFWMFGGIFFEALEAGGEMVDDEAMLATMIGPMMAMYACGMVGSVVSIVAAVFQYIALHDLYHSCNPENSVLFLVLSIFLNVVQPFLIFASRKKDLGMPPRRPQYDQPQQPPVFQPSLPPQPPVEDAPVVEPVESPSVEPDETNE